MCLIGIIIALWLGAIIAVATIPTVISNHRGDENDDR